MSDILALILFGFILSEKAHSILLQMSLLWSVLVNIYIYSQKIDIFSGPYGYITNTIIDDEYNSRLYVRVCLQFIFEEEVKREKSTTQNYLSSINLGWKS